MSRSGYSDDLDTWAMIRWRGAVASAIRGKRGQAFLREVLQVLDNMPVKELAAQSLQADGSFCTIGAVMHARSMPLPNDDDVWGDPQAIAHELGITHALTAEIIYENDEGGWWGRHNSPADRWVRMRAWIASLIIETEVAPV
jgi:hypothetical protein